MERAGATLRQRHSASMEEIQDTGHSATNHGVLTTTNALRGAFTLAEVLVTLGIIGVVAALTIPTLMTKIHHKQYTARLKKFYSTMKQMNISAEEEFGDISTWDRSISKSEFLTRYFAPYIKGSIVETDDDVYYELLDGSRFMLHYGSCWDIRYDVNGSSKPNKEGYDIFNFFYCPANSTFFGTGHGGFSTARSSGTKMNDRNYLLELCRDGKPSMQAGGYCTPLLKYDNWEFKSDYPWK